MTTGLSSAFTASVLDCLCNATNITAPAGFYLKLHLGDPGAAGASNAAANTTRQSCSMAAASGGTITNDAAVTWTVSNTETYSFVSFWSAVSGGTFMGSDNLSPAKSVTAGSTFSLQIGDVDLTLGPVAA